MSDGINCQMEQTRDEQLADPTLHKACIGVLKSLREHWAGATLFVEHPEVPMDYHETDFQELLISCDTFATPEKGWLQMV